MQQEVFFIGSRQRIDELLIFAGSQCCNNKGLCLAARKQGRTMRTGQNTGLGNNLANSLRIASINTFTRIE